MPLCSFFLYLFHFLFSDHIPKRMQYSQPRMIQQHARPGKTHNLLYLYTLTRLVAMHGTFCTCRFPISEPAPIQAKECIPVQFCTFMAKAMGGMLLTTVNGNHFGYCLLFLVYPFHLLIFTKVCQALGTWQTLWVYTSGNLTHPFHICPNIRNTTYAKIIHQHLHYIGRQEGRQCRS
jgi:hypothetical protein